MQVLQPLLEQFLFSIGSVGMLRSVVEYSPFLNHCPLCARYAGNLIVEGNIFPIFPIPVCSELKGAEEMSENGESPAGPARKETKSKAIIMNAETRVTVKLATQSNSCRPKCFYVFLLTERTTGYSVTHRVSRSTPD